MEQKDCMCGCQTQRIASTKRCRPEDASVSLRKLIFLMQEPISAGIYDRQIMILDDFLSHNTIWVTELPYIITLLDLITKRLFTVCLFQKSFERFLSLCSIPPLLTKTSDMIVHKRDIKEYFTFFGYLLVQLQDTDFANLLIETLSNLLERKIQYANNHLPLKACHEGVENSQLPETVARLLEIVEEDNYANFLELTLILADISPVVCQKMIKEKILDFLLIRLMPKWRTTSYEKCIPDAVEGDAVQNFEATSKLLWKLLDVLKDEKTDTKDFPPPSTPAIWCIRYALQVFTLQKNEVNRNQTMGIILKCIQAFPSVVTIKSDLVRVVTTLGAATELGLKGTWAASVQFTSNEDDYNFKKMLLVAIYYIARFLRPLHICSPKRVFPALLKIITPDLKSIWHPHQHDMLLSLGLNALNLFTAELPEEFLYYNGPLKILMITEYFNIDAFDITLLQHCLSTFNYVGMLPHPDILDNFLTNDADIVLLSVCENLLSSPVLTLQIQQCLSYAFSTYELLCMRVAASESASSRLCLSCLERITHPNPEDPVITPSFQICAINFLWEAVVWCNSNLKRFIHYGGIYLFLDFMHQACFPVKCLALGALADMCKEGTCIPHLITWRKNGQTLMPILLEIFREENGKLGVKTGPHGTIADIEVPLMGRKQYHETFREDKNPYSSPAVLDMLGSCRPKIYALIDLLNHRHEVRVDIVNEHYGLYDNNNLALEDQITLLLAENFLALKMGEVWVEIDKDMAKAGIRPVAVDGDVIKILTARYHKWTSHLKTVQDSLLKTDKKKEHIKEKTLYRKVKETKLAESLEALRELDFIARSTERMFRLIRKMKQTNELDRSLQFTEGADHHRTSMHEIKVNPIFNQNVQIFHNSPIDDGDHPYCPSPSPSEEQIPKDVSFGDLLS